MVDEFQDTNRLQCDLVDLLRGPGAELFFVGDEFQSIYGFRHADVRVFRERRAQSDAAPAADAELPLAAGGARGGERAVRLVLRRRVPAAPHRGASSPTRSSGIRSSCSSPTRRAYRDTGVHWRRGEARAVARRVRELVDGGVAAPGEIVLLFAAGTDAESYEDELRKAGLPTYRATGKGYFGQQQVVDLLGYLRLLQNRYDDRALLTVLASPFVGMSNDGLALLRRAASKRPLFAGLERTLPPGLSERDERLLLAFRQRFERLATALPRLSLERLCERVVSEHDYDLAVLAQWDGRRRYANMRKLARLARSYEELRGPDVEGFVRFVAEQEAVGARELEAVAEEEGADAVRLLTIHAAKGLEFKVVIVADAGRDKAPPSADEILALSDGRFGFRVADPVTTKRRGAFDYEAVKDARAGEEAAEKLRLYYVAMTRAKERLIVSGSIDREKTADASTPIGWVLDRLEADEELVGERRRAGRDRARRGAARRSRRPPPRGRLARGAARGGRRRAGRRAARALHRAGGRRRWRRARAAGAGRRRRSRRSIACAGSRSRRCRPSSSARTSTSPSASPACRSGGPTRGGDGEGGLRATEIGDAVHRLLEQVDLNAPAAPDVEQVRAWYPGVTDEELERIRVFVSSYCDSELAARIAALPRVDKETALHLRARRRAAARVSRRVAPRRNTRARPRLQDERSRRAVAGRDRRRRLPAAAARVRARVLPRRGGGGRGRLPLPRAAGRDRLDDLRTRPGGGARDRALRGDRADPRGRVPADAERLRVLRLSRARSRVRRSAAAGGGDPFGAPLAAVG